MILNTDDGEPESFEEAKKDTHNREWLHAMQDEMNSMHENQRYKLAELLKGKRTLWYKWVYKLMSGEGGNPTKYKARIVVKGFQQKKGVDFDEIFAPIVKMTSI